MIFPEITDTHIYFPKGYIFPMEDVTSLRITIAKVYEWIEATGSNYYVLKVK